MLVVTKWPVEFRVERKDGARVCTRWVLDGVACSLCLGPVVVVESAVLGRVRSRPARQEARSDQEARPVRECVQSKVDAAMGGEDVDVVNDRKACMCVGVVVDMVTRRGCAPAVSRQQFRAVSSSS